MIQVLDFQLQGRIEFRVPQCTTSFGKNGELLVLGKVLGSL